MCRSTHEAPSRERGSEGHRDGRFRIGEVPRRSREDRRGQESETKGSSHRSSSSKRPFQTGKVPSRDTRNFRLTDVCGSHTQHQLPSLTLVPPPHLGASPWKKPSLFPYTKNSGSPSRARTTPARRLSLPSLRSLSLLPASSTCTAPTPFRSRNERSPVPSKTPHSSPSKHHPNPPSSLSTPQLPASIRLETSSKLLQRRKLALALKYERKTRIDPVPPPPVLPPSPPRTNSSTPSLEIVDVLSKAVTRMKRTRSSSEEENEEDSLRAKCARWARHVRSSTAEEQVATQSSERLGRELSTGERMKREREVSLGERRGKKLSCLRIV